MRRVGAMVARGLERGFSVWIVLGFLVGLALPTLPVPGPLPAGLLSVVLFFAYAGITREDLRAVRPFSGLGFVALRFGLVPAAVWGAARIVGAEATAPGLLLLALLPSGATSTAVTAILRGNAALALGSTVVTTAAVPVVVPLVMSWAVGAGVGVDPVAMAATLGGIVGIPAVLYGLIARLRPAVLPALRTRGSAMSVALICSITTLVTNGQRARILAQPGHLAALFAAGILFYGLAYAVGLGWGWRGRARDRIGWSIASGNNNIVLGLTLALLHLPDQVVVLLAALPAWIVGLAAIKPTLRALLPSDE
ncbi:MAG: hypothetical protein AAF928_05725 [Myxococcota bacterium]